VFGFGDLLPAVPEKEDENKIKLLYINQYNVRFSL
jgi:hypothetical protein